MATSKPIANLIPKIVGKKCWTEAKKDMFFERFTGTDENSIIQRDETLSKNKGDTVKFGLLMDLVGDGVGPGTMLEGNEESLSYYDMEVTLTSRRFGVRLDSELEEQKSPYDMAMQAKDKLKIRMAQYLDKLIFSTLTASPTTSRVFYGGDATAENEIVDADTLTTDLISKVKRAAKLATPKLRPVMVKGKPHYVLVAHEYAMRDLRTSDKWINAQKDANVRGEDNPIFSGAEGIWDGVVLFSHENVPWTATGASSAKVAHNLLLGAQAAVWAVAKDIYMREKTFDYDDQKGYGIGIIHGLKKSKFNDLDFGVMNIVTGAKAD